MTLKKKIYIISRVERPIPLEETEDDFIESEIEEADMYDLDIEPLSTKHI